MATDSTAHSSGDDDLSPSEVAQGRMKGLKIDDDDDHNDNNNGRTTPEGGRLPSITSPSSPSGEGAGGGGRGGDQALDMSTEHAKGGGGCAVGSSGGGTAANAAPCKLGPNDDELLVLVCTANMGNAEPTEESIQAWLPDGGICRDVLEGRGGDAMDDSSGGRGTEDIRRRVLEGDGDDDDDDYPVAYSEERSASSSSERRFDVIVIGMQEATFKPKKEGGGRDDDIATTEDSLSTTEATLSTRMDGSMSPLTPEDKAILPDYDSEDEDDERSSSSSVAAGGGGRIKSPLGKIGKGIEDTFDFVGKGTEKAAKETGKHINTAYRAIGKTAERAGNLILTPLVMVAGSGGGAEGGADGTTTSSAHRTVFSSRLPAIPALEGAKKEFRELNPTEWTLGTMELKRSIARRVGSGYRFYVRAQRGEMRLFVLVRNELAGRVRVSDVYAENTGLGNVMANKGGMVTILTVGDDTRLSFLTAHLEAHEGKDHYKGRCRNLEEILAGARPGLVANLGIAGNAGIDISPKPSRGFYDASVVSHHSFVCGDLNFRVSLPGGVPGGIGTNWEGRSKEDHKEAVRRMVKMERWENLNDADELFHALRVGDCLTGYKTPRCNFRPTFKVKRKEGFNYIENRTPSYTDRILWKSLYGLEDHVRPLAYGPISGFSTSDHKPMRGAFAVKLNCDASSAGDGGVDGDDSNGLESSGHPPPAEEKSSHGHRSRDDSKKKKEKSSPSSSKNNNNGGGGGGTLHLFISDIKCTNLPKMRPQLKRTDAYIVFVADPLDMVRLERTAMEKILRRVGWTRNKTSKGKCSGTGTTTKVKTRSGWPRTPVAYDSTNPDWGDYEVHLKIKKTDPAKNGGGGDKPTAACEKTEILGPKGAVLYLTVMNYDGAGDGLIGTVALSLPAIYGEGKKGFGADEMGKGEGGGGGGGGGAPVGDSDALPFDVIDIDEPIVRYGKQMGRLQCSMIPWKLDDSGEGDKFGQRKDVHKKEKKHHHHGLKMKKWF